MSQKIENLKQCLKYDQINNFIRKTCVDCEIIEFLYEADDMEFSVLKECMLLKLNELTRQNTDDLNSSNKIDDETF